MKNLRLTVQIIYTILTNGYLYGFLSGKIYQGRLKYACVPGLNCYSCPGALASCPIGTLQALLNQNGLHIPFGVLGFFFLFGSLLGRTVCGWLCPFGLAQDLLHRIPLFRKKKRLTFHEILKYGKYTVLVLLVCAGSMFLFGGFAKVPAFCKYLCPSGTLLGALPLLSAKAIRPSTGMISISSSVIRPRDASASRSVPTASSQFCAAAFASAQQEGAFNSSFTFSVT